MSFICLIISLFALVVRSFSPLMMNIVLLSVYVVSILTFWVILNFSIRLPPCPIIFAALLVSVSTTSTVSPNLSVVVGVVLVVGSLDGCWGVGCVWLGRVMITLLLSISTVRSSVVWSTATLGSLVFRMWFSMRVATIWLEWGVRWIPSLLSMSDRSFSRSSIEISVLALSLLSSLVLNFTTSLSSCLSFSCTAYMGGACIMACGISRSFSFSVIDWCSLSHCAALLPLLISLVPTRITTVVLSGLVLMVFVHAAALSRSRASTYSVL